MKFRDVKAGKVGNIWLCTRFCGRGARHDGGEWWKLNEAAPGSVRKHELRLPFRMRTSFWKIRFLPFPLVILVILIGPGGFPRVEATDSEEGVESASSTEESVSGLPAWEEGDFRDGFDVRIWPERVVMWLEQENLKDLIADPRTPESEREALKRVLAMQQVWPKRI
jgi:hypothetical protein